MAQVGTMARMNDRFLLRLGRYLVALALYLFESSLRGLRTNVAIIVSELTLFAGSLLLTLGLLGFESDRYCDGNTAQYLSCTRPAVYYFYDSIDKIAIALGVMLILVWWRKR